MPQISVTDESYVNAQPNAAFERLSDLSRHSEWVANPMTMEKLSDGAAAKGSKYRSTTRFMGQTIVANLEITEFEPGSHFAFSVEDKTGSFTHDYRLRSQGSGTAITHVVAGKMAMPNYLIFLPIGRFIAKSADRKFHNNLKMAIESPS